MTIPPWSYSSLTKYETCPRQYWLTRVAKKVVEKQTEATLWGNQVHGALEARVKDKTPLPGPMQKWEPLAAMFDGKPKVFTETRFSLTRNLTKTKWNVADTWCRGIVDIGCESKEKGFLGDWKTGKVKHDSSQLKLFAAMFMQYKPYIEVVDTGFVWLADNKMTKETFTRKDLPEIWEDFISRSLRLEHSYKTDKWLPKPSGLCQGWCPAGRENCEFWSPKK